MSNTTDILKDLNDRSRDVFRAVVESYLENGDPVGSRTLTRSLNEKVSAATVRNVMQDLEYLGLLNSPHTSAGRVPTQMGLRMFV
ncbi:heat-inducible transcriptional repressor HrcA, partial [Rhodobacteraceae bacterium R_SAG2]|nr:heat-inducible transcriptional repressor HrcA [Rhodobacteraceae bacterium R_SAG2]